MTSSNPGFYLETTRDAFLLIRAAQEGIIPRTIRRLTYAERMTMVKSGAAFVFCEQDCNPKIKRWTGKSLAT